MSLTNLVVPTYRQQLRMLAGLLDKAQAQMPGAEAEALMSARLTPDMFPLSTQVRFVVIQAQEAVYRLRGEPLPDRLQQVADEGRNGGERPGTIADAKARIDEALSVLDGLAPDALDAGADRVVSLELPNGIAFDMSGEQYVRDWALPQFYFHLVTAYAILRSRGVDLGKADYVPHMFAYLRPGTAPRP